MRFGAYTGIERFSFAAMDRHCMIEVFCIVYKCTRSRIIPFLLRRDGFDACIPHPASRIPSSTVSESIYVEGSRNCRLNFFKKYGDDSIFSCRLRFFLSFHLIRSCRFFPINNRMATTLGSFATPLHHHSYQPATPPLTILIHHHPPHPAFLTYDRIRTLQVANLLQ